MLRGRRTPCPCAGAQWSRSSHDELRVERGFRINLQAVTSVWKFPMVLVLSPQLMKPLGVAAQDVHSESLVPTVLEECQVHSGGSPSRSRLLEGVLHHSPPPPIARRHPNSLLICRGRQCSERVHPECSNRHWVVLPSFSSFGWWCFPSLMQVQASTTLAKCLRRGSEHPRLTGWEALSVIRTPGWRSATRVAKRTGGLAPRGLCPTFCALLPPSGSSSPERSPLSRYFPKDSDPFGLPDIGLLHVGRLQVGLVPHSCLLTLATLKNGSPTRSHKNLTRSCWHTINVHVVQESAQLFSCVQQRGDFFECPLSADGKQK